MPRAKKPFFSDNNPSVVPPPDSNTRSLPDADALLRIGSFLNNKDFANFKQTLMGKKGLLYNVNAFHKVSAAGQLLKATEYADYDQVEKLIAESPSLMFEPVSFKFRDGSEERSSPLRYAFRVLDTYMWKKVFLQRIEEVEDSAKRETYRKKFFMQMKEQEKAGHIDLEPLFQAYEEYNNQYRYWIQQPGSRRPPQEAYYKLGEKQKALLPVHMLKEFSREGFTWRANASFDVGMPWPSKCRVAVLNAHRYLSSILSDSEQGLLMRGLRPSCRWMNVGWGTSDGFRDLAIFRRLLEVRHNDFVHQLSLMSQDVIESQEQQNQRIEIS